MPTIPNFPQSLLNEHMEWHHARHLINIGNPPSGYGAEFLQFHRNFIGRALSWYYQNGNDPRLVEPWASVPEPIRQSACYNRAAEARILLQPQSFSSADELGRFIESSNIHSCIHQEAALLFGEPDLNDFDIAPQSTIFYNIHGMVDRWWQNWEGANRARQVGYRWLGRFGDGIEEESLYYCPSSGNWWVGQIGREDHTARMGMNWNLIGNSSSLGRLDDGRPLLIRDVDGDSKLEILFQDPLRGQWIEGKIRGGRLIWQSARLHLFHR